MEQFEIVATLITIVYGLMLTDLFASLHKIIRARNRIRWHWLPLLAAWYIFLIIIRNWWDIAFMDEDSQWNNIYVFIAYGHFLVLLYLLVSAVLPDKIDEKGLNLKTYYFENHKYFWGLMSAVIFVSMLISIIAGLIKGISFNFTNSIGSFILFVLTGLLALKRNYLLHAILLILFVVMVILELVFNAL